MVQLSILYTKRISNTSDKYGYTLFQNYSDEDITRKLNEPFCDSTFLGLMRSIQKDLVAEEKLYGVGIKRKSRRQSIVATYDFSYVKNIKSLNAYFKTNRFLKKELCLKPYGLHAIQYTGTPTDEELLEIVKTHYITWRLLQELFWDNMHLTIAVFNPSLPVWYIAQTIEDSRVDFRLVKSTAFLK